MRRTHGRAAALCTLALALGCGSCGGAESVPSPALVLPARPSDCVTVAAKSSLQAAVDGAAEGAALCLEPGRYAGPLRLDKRVRLWGPRDAVIESEGHDTTVLVTAPGVEVLGLTIDGSGGRFDMLDAALKVHADDVRVDGVLIVRAIFGVLVEKARRVTVVNTEVRGDPDSPHGMRGDGIRLWETYDSRVEGNIVKDSRDMVVWYSGQNTISKNYVTGGRYGTHFMYSHGNTIEDNRYIGNVVGIFIMYSRNVHLRRNTLADSNGAAGMGIGIKESGNIYVEDNLFIHDSIGAYLDTSPLQQDDTVEFSRNTFRLGGAGVVFHSSPSGSFFRSNVFADNRVSVGVEGDGDALGTSFEGNDFDDYEGFDLDGDGTGDLPYELRTLSSQLTNRHPALAFFEGTPALNLVDAVGRAVPLFTPKPVVRDLSPSMRGGSEEPRHGN